MVDIELRAVAGVLVGAGEPNSLLGDGVDANELSFQAAFPYVAAAHAGYAHEHHAATPPQAAKAGDGATFDAAAAGLTVPAAGAASSDAHGFTRVK